MRRETGMMRRRHVMAAAGLALTGVLGACRPGASGVVSAIEAAPSVTSAEVALGSGGGLRSVISATITTDAGADELPDIAEEAWRRGVEALHDMYDGDRGREVGSVVASGRDGASFSLADLLELDGGVATLGHYYDHYGVG